MATPINQIVPALPMAIPVANTPSVTRLAAEDHTQSGTFAPSIKREPINPGKLGHMLTQVQRYSGQALSHSYQKTHVNGSKTTNDTTTVAIRVRRSENAKVNPIATKTDKPCQENILNNAAHTATQEIATTSDFKLNCNRRFGR